MATYTCSTSRVAGTSPIAQLTVVTDEHTSYVNLNWTLKYHATTAASTSVNKSWSVAMSGTTLDSGTYNINGKTGYHTIASGTKKVSKTKAVQTLTFSLSFGFNLTWSGTAMGVKSASTSVKIPIKPTYTITYNANGGSGAPSSQTKWLDESITLSSTKPTRTGYTFKGWATSASATTSAYDPGDTYTTNAKLTLYAVWSIITYTVTYNANGGSGAPANQTKKYGTTLVLSSTEPTRIDYDFLGWATSASATTTAYDPGDAYTANAAVTLYAVWELAYVKPSIYNLVVYRCDENGTENDTGAYGFIEFDWKCTNPATQIIFDWEAGMLPIDVTGEDVEGSVTQVFGGDLSIDQSYTITVHVKDGDETKNHTIVTITLNGAEFPIDVMVSVDDSDEDVYKYTGIAFGKPAELRGVADFAYEAKFNEPVYGKALGMDKLPEIPANAKLNDYMDPGCYAIYQTANAKTIYCGIDENNEGVLMGSSDSVPPAVAGRLEVWSATGEGIRQEQHSYIRQRFIPYNMGNAVWERTIVRGSANVWDYNSWWRSNLNPSASQKVYHEQKILWGADMTNGYYMSEAQNVTLSEPISAQPNGIVLVFCSYDSVDSTDYDWQSVFVPKELIAVTSKLSSPYLYHSFRLSRGNFAAIGTKYLDIQDTVINGHADNKATGTSNGITYANNKFVLRYVIGV